MVRSLTVIDGRGGDVIAFSRSRVEEAGMDMTTLGHEVRSAVAGVWAGLHRGDFSHVGSLLARLDAKAADLIELGTAMSGDAVHAARCPDGIAEPSHGRAA